jgi:deoxycytidylate deaminase
MKLPSSVVELAKLAASKVSMKQRHGAVVFKRGVILGSGYNFYAAPPSTCNKKSLSIHAERDALSGLRHDQLHGASILVIRLRPNGELSWGGPCVGCKKLLARKGLDKCFYYNELGMLCCCYLQS